MKMQREEIAEIEVLESVANVDGVDGRLLRAFPVTDSEEVLEPLVAER